MMGQCGCGDFNALYRFPGPDGSTYCLQIHPSCQECGIGVGIVLHKFTPELCNEWHYDDAIELKIDGDGTMVEILDGKQLRMHLINEETVSGLQKESVEAIDIEYAMRVAVVDTVNDRLKKGTP